MKTLKLLMLAVFAFVTTSSMAHEQTDTIKVFGECGMCQNRIQKALKVEGITAATWDADTKLLAGLTPWGKVRETVLNRSSTRSRAQYISTSSSKIM